MAPSPVIQHAPSDIGTPYNTVDHGEISEQQYSHQAMSAGLHGETAAITPYSNITFRRKQGAIGAAGRSPSPRDFSIRIRASAQQAFWTQSGQAKGPVLVGEGAAAARDASPGPATPIMGRPRRETLRRRVGTGRQCTGRGFTLCIMPLPVPCPPTTVAKTPAPPRRTPTPTRIAPATSAGTESGVQGSASVGTPMEGVPERLMFKTPALRSRLGQTPAAVLTPSLEGMTPMEGVPERPLQRAPPTARKPIRADAASGSLPRLQRGRNGAPTPASLPPPVFESHSAVSASPASTEASAGRRHMQAGASEPAELRGDGDGGSESDGYDGGDGGYDGGDGSYSGGEEATPADAGGHIRSRWELPTAERNAWGGGEWGKQTPGTDSASTAAGTVRQGGASDTDELMRDVEMEATPTGVEPAQGGVAAKGTTGSVRSTRRSSRSQAGTPSAAAATASSGLAPGTSGGAGDTQMSDGYDAGGGWEDDGPHSSGEAANTMEDSPVVVVVKRKRQVPADEQNQRLRKGIRKSLAGSGLQAEDGVRRTSRTHHRPLEYWRNEKKVFARHYRSLPTVDHIETRTPEPSWPRPSARKRRKGDAATAK